MAISKLSTLEVVEFIYLGIYKIIMAQLVILYESILYIFQVFEQDKSNGDNLKIDISNILSVKLGKENCLKQTDKNIRFKVENSFLVITDIINNTFLYNEYPLKMKSNLEIHRKIIRKLLKHYSGHIVADEGDSYQLVFETLVNAVGFSKDYIEQHHENIDLFKVRIGINNGNLQVKNVCGCKVYGEPVDELIDIFKHNVGEKVCMTRRFFEESNLKSNKLFCIHF